MRMSKIQCRILKKTTEGECPIYVVEIRVKSFWWAPWSDWVSESSYLFESEAMEALEVIAQSWAKVPKKPKVEQIHLVQVKRG